MRSIAAVFVVLVWLQGWLCPALAEAAAETSAAPAAHCSHAPAPEGSPSPRRQPEERPPLCERHCASVAQALPPATTALEATASPAWIAGPGHPVPSPEMARSRETGGRAPPPHAHVCVLHRALLL